MKKSVLLFAVLPLVLAACSPTDNEVDIVQAQSVIEAARAAQDAAQAAQIASQGLSDVGRGQTTILLLLTLILLLLAGLVVFVVIQRLTSKYAPAQRQSTGRWVSGPNAHWKRVQGPDPYQLLLQQQMLLTQLLQLDQDELVEADLDSPQLPDGWW